MRLARGLAEFQGREFMAYIRSELEVGDTSLNVLVVGVVEMAIDDLLGEGQGSV